MEIDGSLGEGGGQLLRFSLGLSALLSKEVTVVNIRANRTPSGIRPQHLAAINAVARLANAKVKGNYIGSSTITFSPGKVTGGEFEFSVGTAGSVTLVLQAILPVALIAERPVVGKITGGTEVRWSPTVDYFDRVFVKGLRSMGAGVSLELIRSGYYPKGGGIVRFSVSPYSQLAPLETTSPPSKEPICHGVSRCANLARSVAERQSSSARALLNNSKVAVGDLDVISSDDPLCPGSSITLWLSSEVPSFIGADSIGERGKPAEIVGSEAARALIDCVKTGSAADDHFADMILPYMLKAEGRSRVTISGISNHLITEVHVARMFDVAEISLDQSKAPPELSVTPKR